MQLFIFCSFCVTCEACSTHSDNNAIGVSVRWCRRRRRLQCHICDFRSFEEMHQFHSMFSEGYIIKYRSSLNLEIISILTVFIALFDVDFWLIFGSQSIAYEGLHQFHSTFTQG